MEESDWIALAGVIVTAGVSVIALFGEQIRDRLFKTVFSATIPELEKTSLAISSDPPERRNAWYQHVKVTKTRSAYSVEDATINILRIYTYDQNNKRKLHGTLDVPLAWRNPALHPTRRPLNGSVVADLCCVIESGNLETEGHILYLWPIRESNAFPVFWKQPVRLEIEVQVQHHRGSGPVWLIEIAWDGMFHPGQKEMRESLQVSKKQLDR